MDPITFNSAANLQDVFLILSKLFTVFGPMLVLAVVLGILPELFNMAFIALGLKKPRTKKAKKDYKTWRDPRKRPRYSKLATGSNYIPKSQNPYVKQNKDGSAWVHTKRMGKVFISADKKPWVHQIKGSGAFVYIAPKSKRKHARLWRGED